MSSSHEPATTGAPAVSSHNSDHVNLRVTYLHAGNPRPPHTVGAIPATTTIGELKGRLQADLLEHPRPEEQRLIFQGRPLMQNDATLRQALRLEGPIGPLPYTIHIIFQPRRASAHFRPDQPSQMAQPQPNTGQPAGTLPNPPHPPADPQAAMQQAQRVQAMAQAQLSMLQQQMAALNPAFAQTMGHMPQNFSATFQIHGQPIQVPQNMPLNMRPAPGVPNLEALRAAQQIPTAQSPMASGVHNHGALPSAGSHAHQHATAQPTTHLAPNLPSGVPPFARPSSAPGHPPHRRSATGATTGTPALPTFPRSIPIGLPQAPMFNHLPHPFAHTQPTTRPSGQPTVWLASSRNGPEALLFAPGHGYFTSQGAAPNATPTPTPTTQPSISPAQTQPPATAPPPPAANADQGQVAIRHPELPALPAQQRPPNQAQDDNEFWGLIVQRGWLFLRLYMFMFVLSEPGTWRRYTLLVAAVIVCLLPRENPLNNAFAAARRHVDRLIGPPHPQPRDRERDGAGRQEGGRQVIGQAVATAVQGNNAAQGQAAPATGQALPARGSNAPPPDARGAVNVTPEQNARRLVREQQFGNPNVLRDMFYWIEQAVALFLASLVPGVGERHVAAREEARRQDERERVEAQRAREEEEKKRKDTVEEVEKQVADEKNVEEGERSKKGEGVDVRTANSSAETGSSTDVEVGSSSGVEAASEGQEDAVRARFT